MGVSGSLHQHSVTYYAFETRKPTRSHRRRAGYSQATLPEQLTQTTGKFTFNVTGVPSGTEAIGPAGEILRYTITNIGNTTDPNWRLTEWNSSKCFQAQTSGLINLTAQTTQTGKGYDWNVSITGFGVGMSSPSIQAVLYDDLILGRNGSLSSRLKLNVPYITYWAISLKPASRGTLLWMKNILRHQTT